jgi:hypothetical protein
MRKCDYTIQGLKMRIRELLENNNRHFDDAKFVSKAENGEHKIDYDLVEDLTFFMHDDDDTYRRHVFPSVAKCLDRLEAKKTISPNIFAGAVKESYKNYIKKFPIRELPDDLDEQLFAEVCDKLHEDFKKHHAEGKYKD